MMGEPTPTERCLKGSRVRGHDGRMGTVTNLYLMQGKRRVRFDDGTEETLFSGLLDEVADA